MTPITTESGHIGNVLARLRQNFHTMSYAKLSNICHS